MSNLEKWLAIAPELPRLADLAYSDSEPVAPPRDRVFYALELLPPEDVCVVILGQDPYPTEGRASGIAFGYHPDYQGRPTSSLKHILEEARRSGYEARDTTLESWLRQGVLLLNTALTVRVGKPMSHEHIGWRAEIQKIIEHLATRENVMFLTWGAEARALATVSGVPRHRIIQTTHPCKFSHKRGTATLHAFTGSRCFEHINELLVRSGQEPIVW